MELNTKEVKLAVLGNCATQFFSKSVEGYAKLSGINLIVLDVDYNQIDAQLLDESSEVYCFKPDEILVWLATDELYEEFLDLPQERKGDFADVTIERLESYWDMIDKNCNARILQPNFTEIDDKGLGQYSCKIENTFTYQIRKLNFLLEKVMSERKEVYPVDLFSVQIRQGQRYSFDGALYYKAQSQILCDG